MSESTFITHINRSAMVKEKTFNSFLIGFVIYTLGASFPNLSQVSYYFTQSVQLIGLVIFLLASVNLIEWKFDNNYLMFAFVIYCIWSGFIIIRGIHFNYSFFKVLLLDTTTGIFFYLAPFIILFPRSLLFLKRVFLTIVILGLFFLFYDILYFRPLFEGTPGSTIATGMVETFSGNLSLTCGFLLLTFVYHTDGRNTFALIILFITFLFASIRARRALMFMSFTTLFAAYVQYFISNRKKALNVFLSFLLILLIFIIGIKVYSKTRTGVFALITERIDADTRSYVEKSFYYDMGTADWIIGRGLSGKYYCPGIDPAEGGSAFYRTVVESGYLQTILKGGIISILVILLLLIPAIFKGFFDSKNLLSKAAAVWMLLFILFSYPGNINDFSLKYLVVWLSAAICYNTEIRNMTDDEIRCQLAK